MDNLVNSLLTIYCVTYFISLLSSRVFNIKYNKTQLYCGIFGCFPIPGKPVNILKIKLLGLDNVERGRDSCGYYYGGNIQKGIDKVKEFNKYLEEHFLEKGELYPLFLGHTRSASPGILGGYSAFNAHPFECDNLVLTHNGVIYNILELSEKYNVDVTGLNVDSHKLTKIISEAGLDVLHHYVGAAALAFTLKTEPYIGYLYHGKSYEKPFVATAKDNRLCYEERPLFCMQTEDGMFYSSKIEGLLRIRENDKEVPYQLEHNTVFKVVNGVLLEDEADIMKIERIENNLRIDDYKNKVWNESGFFPKGGTKDTTATKSYTNSPAKINNLAVVHSTFVTPQTSLILSECLPLRARIKTNICFYWKGRYWIKDAEGNNQLADGTFVLDKKGFIVKEGSTGSKKYYFYVGVMIKDKAAYDRLTLDLFNKEPFKSFINNPSANFAYWIADYAEYPVTCLSSEGVNCIEAHRFKWFDETSDDKLKRKEFQPKFSSRTYHFSGNYLRAITTSDKSDKFIFSEDESVMDLSDPDEPTDNALNAVFESQQLKEAFAERKQTVRVNFNSIFDDKRTIIQETDSCNILSLMLQDLFTLDYNVTMDDPKELSFYINQFLGECIDCGLTIMENLSKDFDLEVYLLNYFDNTFDSIFPAKVNEGYNITNSQLKKKYKGGTQ